MKPANIASVLVTVTVTALSALSAIGCSSTSQRIDDRADQKIAAIHDDGSSLAIQASCADGKVLGADCGLVTARVAMPDFREKFRAVKCAGDSAEVCQTKLDQSVDAWLTQRYMLADFQGVNDRCDAVPGKCDDPREYELALLRSHDASLAGVTARREDVVEQQRAVAHAIDDAQREDAVMQGIIVVAYASRVPRRHY